MCFCGTQPSRKNFGEKKVQTHDNFFQIAEVSQGEDHGTAATMMIRSHGPGAGQGPSSGGSGSLFLRAGRMGFEALIFSGQTEAESNSSARLTRGPADPQGQWEISQSSRHPAAPWLCKGVEQRRCPSPPVMVGIHWGAPANCVSSAMSFGEKQWVRMFVGIALPDDTPLPMDQVLEGCAGTQAGHVLLL